MKIKTSYDCTFERRDFVNLANGHGLSATLSDGSVAFKFQMDDEVRAALMGGTLIKQVNGVVVDAPRNGTRMLTDGTKKQYRSALAKGVCPYCKTGRALLLQPHVRVQHPGKPWNPTGKFRCQKCVERYDSPYSLKAHVEGAHNRKKKTVAV